MNNVACMYTLVRKTNGAMTPAFHHHGLGKKVSALSVMAGIRIQTLGFSQSCSFRMNARMQRGPD